jgi:hypothetical protein
VKFLFEAFERTKVPMPDYGQVFVGRSFLKLLGVSEAFEAFESGGPDA